MIIYQWLESFRAALPPEKDATEAWSCCWGPCICPSPCCGNDDHRPGEWRSQAWISGLFVASAISMCAMSASNYRTAKSSFRGGLHASTAGTTFGCLVAAIVIYVWHMNRITDLLQERAGEEAGGEGGAPAAEVALESHGAGKQWRLYGLGFIAASFFLHMVVFFSAKASTCGDRANGALTLAECKTQYSLTDAYCDAFVRPPHFNTTYLKDILTLTLALALTLTLMNRTSDGSATAASCLPTCTASRSTSSSWSASFSR